MRADRTDAGAALAEVAMIVAPQTHAAGLTLAVEPCTPDLVARADPAQVRQVLLHLLSDAITCTAAGGTITLGCRCTADARVALYVSGTPRERVPDQPNRGVERVLPLDGGPTWSESGATPALAVARDLARAMGGELTAARTSPVGSTVVLTLPLTE